jgi:ribose-phosphate pyrophosphokinase
MSKPLVFCGRASVKVAKEVCRLLDQPLEDMYMQEFADAEPWYQITDPSVIEGAPCVVIQSTGEYAPKMYFDLLAILHTVKRFKPSRLIAVMPFMGFRRQERDRDGGEAVMAQLVAELIAAAGATDVILCDPHSPKNIEYFEAEGVKVHVIDANMLFISALQGVDLTNYRVFSPDKGRAVTAEALAKALGVPMISLNKRRPEHDVAESDGIQDDLRGIISIIREDEISTAGTIDITKREMEKVGAENIIVMATHGVLAGGALQKLKRAKVISRIYITDSIYQPWEKRNDKIVQLPLAPLIHQKLSEILAEL